jgi:hypothetical protein
VTLIETTEGEINWAMLLTLAPVDPKSIALLPLGQLPLFAINNALVLLSTHALTTDTDKVFAIAKPLATVTPKENAVMTLKVVVFFICSPVKKLGSNLTMGIIGYDSEGSLREA